MRFELASLSVLIGAANAYSIAAHSNMYAQQDAQPVQEQAGDVWQQDSGCCCTMMPCMPMCQQSCQPPLLNWPPVLPQAPDIIINVNNNMEAVLTQIINEVINSPTNPPPPIEQEGDIVNIAIPIMQMFMQTEIFPQWPECPYEPTTAITGHSLNMLAELVQLGGEVEAGEGIPTALEMMQEVLQALSPALDTTVLDGTADLSELADYIDVEGIIEDVLVTDADGHTHEIVVTELDGDDNQEEDADAGDDETPVDDSTDADSVTEDDGAEDDGAEDLSGEVETEEADVVEI